MLFRSFEGTEPIVPGITPIPTPGHTPGHTSYLLESRSDRMLVWGDVVESGAVQFGKPQATMEGEFDDKGAVASTSTDRATNPITPHRVTRPGHRRREHRYDAPRHWSLLS